MTRAARARAAITLAITVWLAVTRGAAAALVGMLAVSVAWALGLAAWGRIRP